MRNLSIVTNAANRQRAWADWNRLAKQAHELGLSDVVRKLQPLPVAGWRAIDRQIVELRSKIEAEREGNDG